MNYILLLCNCRANKQSIQNVKYFLYNATKFLTIPYIKTVFHWNSNLQASFNIDYFFFFQQSRQRRHLLVWFRSRESEVLKLLMRRKSLEVLGRQTQLSVGRRNLRIFIGSFKVRMKENAGKENGNENCRNAKRKKVNLKVRRGWAWGWSYQMIFLQSVSVRQRGKMEGQRYRVPYVKDEYRDLYQRIIFRRENIW